jgi:iron-sulfur cluster assembly protein
VNVITVTDDALKHLQQLRERKNVDELGLRVYVQPGGCSGFSYGMAIDDDSDDDDRVYRFEGIRVVVDPFSLQHIEGAEIDYVDALMGGGFQVRNPNAAKSCACGQSFDSVHGGGSAKPCS